ncbi:gp53-like domain-containing protein [Aeromonas veronii]|uniref:gp53-like domain-containing protein n=1 Tax=Aeromonas veronii TaxID=654 RepID=UPI003F678609
MAYWIDTGTGTPTDPGTTAVISAVRQYATEGGVGVQPTIPGAEWFNMITDELLAVLSAAGITPDKSDHGQLAASLLSMFTGKSEFSSLLANNGYQKLFGGLIFQWGSASGPAGPLSLTFPISFPNACVFVAGAILEPGTPSAPYAVSFSNPTPSGVTAYRANAAGGLSAYVVESVKWVSIGY